MKNFPKTERNNDAKINVELYNKFNSSEKNIMNEQEQNIAQDIDKNHIIYKLNKGDSHQNIQNKNTNNNLFCYLDNVREQTEKKENEKIETKTKEINKENPDFNNNQNKTNVNETTLENINKNKITIVNVEKNNEKLNRRKCTICGENPKKVCKCILYLLLFIMSIIGIILFFSLGGKAIILPW